MPSKQSGEFTVYNQQESTVSGPVIVSHGPCHLLHVLQILPSLRALLAPDALHQEVGGEEQGEGEGGAGGQPAEHVPRQDYQGVGQG